LGRADSLRRCHRSLGGLCGSQRQRRGTQGVGARFYRALYDEAHSLGPVPHELNHYLANVREKAGVPQPPEPWQVDVIRRQAPLPAAPVIIDKPREKR
jgi:hypothetical protein